MPGSIAHRFDGREFLHATNGHSPVEIAQRGISDGFDRGWEAALEAVEALYPDLDMKTIERRLLRRLGMTKEEVKDTYCAFDYGFEWDDMDTNTDW